MTKILVTFLLAIASVTAFAQGCPATFEVSGGLVMCSAGTATIKLSASERYTEYYLYRYDVPVTGSRRYSTTYTGALTWSVSQSGDYSVKASNENCSNVFMGMTTVTYATPTSIGVSYSGNASAVCNQSDFILTATGVTGCSWRTPEGTTRTGCSINAGVYGVSGNYTVTGQNNCGSTQSATVAITIIERVNTPSIPSGPVTICKGTAQSQYSSTALNATSYTWAVSGSGNTISGNGLVTWNSSFTGSATITVTAYGCGGSSASRSTTVSVNTIGGAGVSGDANICNATTTPITLAAVSLDPEVLYTLRLNGAPEGGAKYGGDAAGNPVSSITWIKSAPGVYTVTATGRGCTDVPMVGSATITIKTPTTVSIAPSGDLSRICNGSNFYLTGSGASSNYTWYTPEGTTTTGTQINVGTRGVQGTYYAKGVNNCGTSQTSNPITINYLPLVSKPSVPSGLSALCKGSANTTYSSSAANATAYMWEVSGSGNTMQSPGVVKWSSTFTGAAIVKVTAAGNCNSTDWNSLTVNVGEVAPAFVSGGGSYCGSGTAEIVLTGNPTLDPETSYTLLLNGTPLSSSRGEDQVGNPLPSITWTKSALGVYTAVGSARGCDNFPMTGSATISKKLPTVITVTPSKQLGEICEGDAITLTASGASSYQWYLRSPAGSNEPDLRLHPTTPDKLPITEEGFYYVKGVDLNCNTAIQSDPIEVLFRRFPNALLSPREPVTICTSCSQNITASTGNGYSYEWFKNGSPIPSAVSSSYPATTSGTYSAKISVAGCVSFSNEVVITSNQPPVISPIGDLNIPLDNPNVSIEGMAYDPDGQIASFQWTKISGGTVTINNAGTAKVNLSQMAAGAYQFRLTVRDNLNDATTADVNIIVSSTNNNYNFVKEHIVNVGGKVNASDVLTSSPTEVLRNYNYFDGFGRPMQSVAVKNSPTFHDLVVPKFYDAFGRESRQYLPIVPTSDEGTFRAGLLNSDGDYVVQPSTYTDLNPYSETYFEASPTARPLKKYGPGQEWRSANKAINLQYESNLSSENVIAWKIDGSGSPIRESAITGVIASGGYYDNNQLLLTITKNEEGNQVREFKDKSGKVILRKLQAVSNPSLTNPDHWSQTYYVYDIFGNLRFVFQPELSKIVQSNSTNVPSATQLQTLTFQYRYDSRNRMVEKQVPGSGVTYMVYDVLDRLVMTQDANQRLDRKWSFSLYDQLNRPVMTGVYQHPVTIDQSSMTSKISTSVFWETYNGDALNYGYTKNVLFNDSDFASGTFEILTTTYYDSYAFKSLIPSAEMSSSDVNYLSNVYAEQYKLDVTGNSFPNPAGQVTGLRTRTLDTTTPLSLWTLTYYDDKLRPVQTVASNHLGGVDRVTNIYDFVGKVLKTTLSHRVGSVTHVVAKRYEYDHAARMTKTWHKVDTRPEVILLANQYNELGQLITKKLHASADNNIDEEGVKYSTTTIVSSQYNNEKYLIASQGVILQPGFVVPAGKSFRASTEQQWTSSNSNPADAAYSQIIDFSYNIRGWMTKINDVANPGSDLFSMTLNYTTPSSTGGPAQFNGNISESIWKTSGSDLQSYAYKYDPLERLTDADYFNRIESKMNGRFTEKITAPSGKPSGYDLNGNILRLQRWGKKMDGVFGAMDDLGYTYVGNQVTRIDDLYAKSLTETGFKEDKKEDGEYGYDANGNMIVDKNKGLVGASGTKGITYNLLNLPARVEKNAAEYLTYTYDATGRKLRQQVFGATAKTTDYAGDFIYENNVLQFVNTEEGRVLMNTSVPAYEYFLKDHLGNTRVSFKAITETSELKTNFEEAENKAFLNYPIDNAAYKSSMNEFDHSDPGTLYTRSQRLTGGPGSQVGITKSYEVMAGDVFDLEVFGKFEVKTSSPLDVTALGAAIAGSIIPIPAGTGLESNAAKTAISNSYGTGVVGRSESTDEAVPKAYLNYILFDVNFAVVDFGYDQIDASAGGLSAAHDQMSLHVAVQKKGYLYVFISNENTDFVQNVYFDDFKIRRSTYVESANDYYPFGLTFNSYQREDSQKQSYLYNGKEMQDELGLGWLDYGARMYQAELGRFFTQDRFAEKYMDLTPYHYAANNPILFIDVNGDSLNVSQLQNYDADASQALTSDLAAKTGLTLTTDADGNVTYAKDENGKAVVARDEDGKKVGSRAARKALTKIINSDQTISVGGTSGLTKTDMDGPDPNLILFNPQQTQDAMNNTSSDLNKTTNGYALTFFHEVGHTKYGGAGQDPPFVSGQNAFNMPGRQENLPNRIRRQLGSDYGQRSSYNSWRVPGVSGQNYFPWGAKALRQLKAGNVPTQQFIIHPWGK